MRRSDLQFLNGGWFKKPHTFTPIECFAYSYYLKKKLAVKNLSGKPEQISILNTNYTKRRLESALIGKLNAQAKTDSFYQTIFKWIKKKTVPDKRTLNDIFITFNKEASNHDIELLSFDDFTKNKANVDYYIQKHINAYLFSNSRERKKFDIVHVLAYYGYYRGQIDSDKDNKALKTVALLIGLLTIGKNSLSKEVSLQRQKRELKRLKPTNSYSKNLVRKALKDINNYRKDNPLNSFGKFLVHIRINPIFYGSIFTILLITINIIFHSISSSKSIEQPKFFQIEYSTDNANVKDDLLKRFSELPVTRDTFNTPNSGIDTAAIWYNRGISENNRDLKIKYFSKAISYDATFADAYAKRSQAWAISNEPLSNINKAITDITLAIKFDSEYYLYYFLKSGYELQAKEYEKALFDIEKALDLCMTQDTTSLALSTIYYARGTINHLLRNEDSSIQDITKAIMILPAYKEQYHIRGLAYRNLKEYEKAISDFQVELSALRGTDRVQEIADVYWDIAACYSSLAFDKKITRVRDNSYLKQHIENSIIFLDSGLLFNPSKNEAWETREELQRKLSNL